MKWMRCIKEAFYTKEEPQFKTPIEPEVYVPSCGWGVLRDFTAKGSGYIKFQNGSGQIVRNWDHFLGMVEIIKTRSEEDE